MLFSSLTRLNSGWLDFFEKILGYSPRHIDRMVFLCLDALISWNAIWNHAWKIYTIADFLGNFRKLPSNLFDLDWKWFEFDTMEMCLPTLRFLNSGQVHEIKIYSLLIMTFYVDYDYPLSPTVVCIFPLTLARIWWSSAKW